jgi:signal transduction histidine kinase
MNHLKLLPSMSRRTLGGRRSAHIEASAGIRSAPARNSISVVAPIAVFRREAKDSAMRVLRIAAWAVATATFVSMGLALADARDAASYVPWELKPFIAVSFLAPTVVGLVIANRQPGNRVAWILLLGTLTLTVQFPIGVLEGAGWRLQMDRALWPLLYAWPIAVTFVFPNGRFLTPRWRWVGLFGVVSFVGFITMAMLDPTAFEGEDAAVPNPIAGNSVGQWFLDHAVWVPFWIGILATLILGAISMILRLRRSTGIERLQMMWFTWSAALIPLGLMICATGWTAFAFIGDMVFPFLLLMQTAISVSIGIAVLRYRLYAIERIVNRTLVYGALTFLLIVVYAAITVGLGVLVGGDSTWVVALATLVVAVVFRPLRSRIQDLVDRRFRRARYEGVRRVRTFEDEVRDGRRAPEEIGAVLADALADPLAELFFWLPETAAYADALGDLVELPVDARARRELRRDDAPTAMLLHDPALHERRDLLDGVLGAAALSIEMARLRVEVRIQLAEVEASRTRIVEAGYEERRRLERDLHDGAQQRLVSLGVQLRRLQFSLPREASVLSPALDQIVGEVGAAIGDLRHIAAGVRPARLDDGLAAALRDLARTAPIPVDVDASRERVAASVEAAAYFVACEAITNAVKHATPSKVAVRTVRDNGTLRVSVSDDGVGGAVVRRGSGLAGLRDRVAAHGGTLEVVSPRGGGTRIEVAIPCES